MSQRPDTIKFIQLKKFNNRLALEMGLAIIELAKSRNQHIAIEITRLNPYDIFICR